MNRNERCVICEKIFLNTSDLQPIIKFKKILNTFTPTKSFNIMALDALSLYNTKIIKRKDAYIQRGFGEFPELTREQILRHLEDCNTCNTQILYSTFNFASDQQNVYKKKLINLTRNDDNNMRDDDDDNEYEEEKNNNIKICTEYFQKFTNIMLQTNKAISQNVHKY